MRGELIGDEVGVLTLGSLSSDCLVSAAALPLSGLISSTVMSLDLAERGLSVVWRDLLALNGICSFSWERELFTFSDETRVNNLSFKSFLSSLNCPLSLAVWSGLVCLLVSLNVKFSAVSFGKNSSSSVDFAVTVISTSSVSPSSWLILGHSGDLSSASSFSVDSRTFISTYLASWSTSSGWLLLVTISTGVTPLRSALERSEEPPFMNIVAAHEKFPPIIAACKSVRPLHSTACSMSIFTSPFNKLWNNWLSPFCAAMKAATNALSSMEIWFILIAIRLSIWRLSLFMHLSTNLCHHGGILSSNVIESSTSVSMSAIICSSLSSVVLFSPWMYTSVNKSDGTPLFTSTVIFTSRTIDERFAWKFAISPVGKLTWTWKPSGSCFVLFFSLSLPFIGSSMLLAGIG